MFEINTRSNPKPIGKLMSPAEINAFQAMERAKAEREMGIYRPTTIKKYGVGSRKRLRKKST